MLPAEIVLVRQDRHAFSPTHPSSECLERIHTLFIECAILADTITRSANRCRRCGKVGVAAIAVALHVPHFLVQLHIVILECFDFSP